MITISLTTEEYCAVRELVREAREERAALAAAAAWPEDGHHEAVASVLARVEDSLVAGFAARLDAIRCGT